jgi:uncharacterized protein YkwD
LTKDRLFLSEFHFMKYYLFNIISILITVLGITATAQAEIATNRSHYTTDRVHRSPSQPTILWVNGNNKVIGTQRQITMGSQSPAIASLSMNSLEIGVYQQVNQYRQSLKLPPLAIDPRWSAQARAHSEQMARTGNLIHRVEPLAQQVAYPTAAENVARSQGYRQPDLIAVQGWIASPQHQRHTIGRYNRTGIGVAQNARGEYYFTQIFIYQR